MIYTLKTFSYSKIRLNLNKRSIIWLLKLHLTVQQSHLQEL
jgi:hypothetical protein